MFCNSFTLNTIFPVVTGGFAVPLHHITPDVKPACSQCIAVVPGIKEAEGQFKDPVLRTAGGSRTWFVVIADHVVKSFFTAIYRVVSPIVNYIVAEIGFFPFRVIRVARTTETGIPAGMIADQVVVKSGIVPPPDSPIPMFPRWADLL